ncbi:hypothetical protein FRC01_005997 [Tulasnella sp. 417]|nr:hypothetical protein FRC01_005997 [Tulasnella sp. 417]
MSQPSTLVVGPVPVAVDNKHTNIDPRSHVQIANDRTFSKQAGSLYSLPTDRKEHSRLDYQHEMMRLLLNDSIYPNPDVVDNALTAEANPTPNIVDLGTGSGVWAMEMARKFPHSKVLACDIVLPGYPKESIPSNCCFEFLNINKDMGKLQPIFDVVHWRLVEPATVDSDLFFYDVARILRPGGIFIAVAANPRLLDETGTVIPLKREGDPKYSHFQHLMKKVNDYQFAEGPPRLLHGHWDEVLGRNPNFQDFKVEEFLIPSGPWEEGMTYKRREIAEMMNENYLRVVRGLTAGLRVHGKVTLDEIEKLEVGSLKEFRELSPGVHAYTKWVFATAVRTDLAWSARTQPWKVPEWFGPADYIIPPFSDES